MCVDVI